MVMELSVVSPTQQQHVYTRGGIRSSFALLGFTTAITRHLAFLNQAMEILK
jgi:hypothetical protein